MRRLVRRTDYLSTPSREESLGTTKVRARLLRRPSHCEKEMSPFASDKRRENSESLPQVYRHIKATFYRTHS
jgi:hypothetical protein